MSDEQSAEARALEQEKQTKHGRYVVVSAEALDLLFPPFGIIGWGMVMVCGFGAGFEPTIFLIFGLVNKFLWAMFTVGWLVFLLGYFKRRRAVSKWRL